MGSVHNWYIDAWYTSMCHGVWGAGGVPGQQRRVARAISGLASGRGWWER